jgi:hypothetical protein
MVNAQRFNVSAGMFYGTFDMTSMKDFQDDFTHLGSHEGKIVDNFPGYFGYNAQAGYSLSRRCDIGLRYQYTSTGGRMSYGDYSGEYRMDNLLNANSYGIFTTIRLNKSMQWPIQFTFATGMVKTNAETIYYFRLVDTESSETFYSHSTNYYFNPAFNVNRRLTNHFLAYASAGYEFQIHGDLIGKRATAEWDGVRLGFGITYLFNFENASGSKFVTEG